MKDPKEIHAPFDHVRTQRKTAIYAPARGSSLDNGSASAFILDILASRTVRNIFLLFISHPIYSILHSSPNRLRQSSFLFVHILRNFHNKIFLIVLKSLCTILFQISFFLISFKELLSAGKGYKILIYLWL